MIIVLRRGTTDAQRDELVGELESYGLGVQTMFGGGKPLLHIVSGPTRRARRILRAELVEALVPTSGPRIRRAGHRIYPYHFIHWCGAGIVIFGVMVLLAGQLPPGTGAPIQLDQAPEHLSWPWYLRAPLGLLLAFGPERRWIGWLVLLLIGLAVVLLPVLDRTRGDGPAQRWPVIGAGIVLLAVAGYLTFAGVAA